MSSQQATVERSPIAPADLARIVGEVIARLQTVSGQTSAVTIPDRVVDVKAIDQISPTASEITVAATAIVTPAASDEARRRGLAIRRGTNHAIQKPTTPASPPLEIIDKEQPGRADAIAMQLSRRGIVSIGATVILSETPSREVYQTIHRSGQPTVMITAFADVERCMAELTPEIWVLDMKRLNLVAAVNVIAKISKTASQNR